MRRVLLVLLLLAVAVGPVGCGIVPTTPAASVPATSWKKSNGGTLADRVVAKLDPKPGEKMNPPSSVGFNESDYVIERLLQIIDGDPDYATTESNAVSGVNWFVFSDGSKLTLRSKATGSGSDPAERWIFTSYDVTVKQGN